MFGRDLRAAEHRRHMPLPQSPGYTFERVGSAPRVAGQCSNCDGMGRETYETESGKLSTQTCTACGGTGVTASRRTAFLDGFDMPEPRHRVAGWDWDDHLNGFVAVEAAREFTCACGDNVPAPGYTDCRCGKRWNAYSVVANGQRKMIAREVPVRQNVVMARTASSRKQAADYSNYSYDQLVDERDTLRQQYADWEIDQSEYRDTLAEIEAEAESRGLNLASREGRDVAAREFTCSCGSNIPAPGYTDCRCGKRWNAYTVSANGSKKMIAREVPVRENVVMANRRVARPSEKDLLSIVKSIAVSVGFPNARSMKMYDGRFFASLGQDHELYIEPTGRDSGYDWTVENKGRVVREGYGMTSGEITQDIRGSGVVASRKQSNVTWYPAPGGGFTSYNGPDPFGTEIPIGMVSENHGQYRWNVDNGADFFESGSESSLQAAQSAAEQALSRAPSAPAGGGGGNEADILEQFLDWRTDMGKMNENAVSDQELLQDLNEYNPPFSSQEVIKKELGLF